MKKMIFVHGGNKNLEEAIGLLYIARIRWPALADTTLRHPAEKIVENLAACDWKEHKGTLPFHPNPELTNDQVYLKAAEFVRMICPDHGWIEAAVKNMMDTSFVGNQEFIILTSNHVISDYMDRFERHFNIFHVHSGLAEAHEIDPHRPGVFVPDSSEAEYAFNQIIPWIFN